MVIVGITGSVSSGKTTVTKMFARLGVRVINTDRITHELLKPSTACSRRVVKSFGPGILAGKRIDRRKLAAVVFGNASRRRELERIVHPAVRRETVRRIRALKKRNCRLVVVEVPLLFEAGFDRLCDVTIAVTARRGQQIARTVKARPLTRAQVVERIKAQMPLQEKTRRADHVVNNSRSRLYTEKQVRSIYRQLLAACQ